MPFFSLKLISKNLVAWSSQCFHFDHNTDISRLWWLMHILFYLNGFTAAFHLKFSFWTFFVYGKAAVVAQALLVKSLIILWKIWILWKILTSFDSIRLISLPAPPPPNLLKLDKILHSSMLAYKISVSLPRNQLNFSLGAEAVGQILLNLEYLM